MLWVLDNDVSAAVGVMLRQRGHRCVMVGQIGLGSATDDHVSVFADDRNAVFLTHDRELIERRRSNTFGRHVLLACREWDAPPILAEHLATVIELVCSREAIVVRLSREGPTPYPSRWD